MSQLNRVALKAFFETGDKPTEAQFIDLIDSCFNLINNADSIVYSKKLLIPTADVLLLYTNPQDFIPSPGPNKYIRIIAAQIFVDFNSIVYKTNLHIDFITDTANTSQCRGENILGVNISTTRLISFIYPSNTTATQLIPNKKVLIKVLAGPPWLGNSDITCYALYKIIDV